MGNKTSLEDTSGAALASYSPKVGKRKMKKLKRAEREKNKGKDWFNMPALELTEERKADLELLQMRGVLDPKRFYKRSDKEGLPKYFQWWTTLQTSTQTGCLTRQGNLPWWMSSLLTLSLRSSRRGSMSRSSRTRSVILGEESSQRKRKIQMGVILVLGPKRKNRKLDLLFKLGAQSTRLFFTFLAEN